MKTLSTIALAFCAGLALPTPAAQCTATSGPLTTALIELYTSEGCSSCPPADRQLSRLAGDQVAALGLHVDYWDYLGWKDAYARPEFSARQRWLTQANHGNTVYTPQFFVSGREARWWEGGLEGEMRRASAQPARATLKVAAVSAGSGQIIVTATAASADSNADGTQLYLALTESGLVSRVAAGENQGATLNHDNVVRQWLGPVALTHGAALLRQSVVLAPAWQRSRLRLVAFLEDVQNGEVLQAVESAACIAE